ncbi:hypothetical protein SOD10_38100 [Serratia plymuthica]|nr:hypothetical protein SOD10_38100 [Serratia plymuthica]
MTDKTKATLQGGQCRNKTESNQVSTMIDQVNSLVSQNDELNKYTILYFFNYLNYQPLGSMPRCCSSLRNIRLIQVARDVSPSLRISSSNCVRNSSLRRIGNCGDRFSGIDMVYTIGDIVRVYTSVYASISKTQRLVVRQTHTRRLTTTLEGLTLWLRQSVPTSLRRSTAPRRKLSPSCCALRRLMSNQRAGVTLLIMSWCLPAACRCWEALMSNLIERTPLTPDELAFQCLALTHAALYSTDSAVREALLFILLDKADSLYEMLPVQEAHHA